MYALASYSNMARDGEISPRPCMDYRFRLDQCMWNAGEKKSSPRGVLSARADIPVDTIPAAENLVTVYDDAIASIVLRCVGIANTR